MQLGDNHQEPISHRYTDTMLCMKSITRSMYKLLTKQMSTADMAAVVDLAVADAVVVAVENKPQCNTPTTAFRCRVG